MKKKWCKKFNWATAQIVLWEIEKLYCNTLVVLQARRRNLYCRGSSVLQYSGVQGFKTVLQYSLLGSSVLQYTALYSGMRQGCLCRKIGGCVATRRWAGVLGARRACRQQVGRWACWRWARRQGARGRRLGEQGALGAARHGRCRQRAHERAEQAARARGARQAGRRHWARAGLAAGAPSEA